LYGSKKKIIVKKISKIPVQESIKPLHPTEFTLIEKVWVSSITPSAKAITVNSYIPGLFGIPSIEPSEFNFNPGGRTLSEASL
jgi:hypothetical protein